MDKKEKALQVGGLFDLHRMGENEDPLTNP